MIASTYTDVVTESALPSETRRLAAIGQMFDADTHRVLTEIGLWDGMRCLDAGAGTGAIANWLAGEVGSGSVVALDIETAVLTGRCAPNVRVVQADVTTAELAPGSFDLVHARLLLQNVRQREAALERMISWLAPGGVLVVSDSWFPPLHGTMSTALVSVHNAVQTLGEQVGASWDWAPRLPALMARHGLEQPGISACAPPLRANNTYATMLGLLIEMCRPHLVASGLSTEDEIGAALASLADPGLCATPYLLISAWGRKPGTS